MDRPVLRSQAHFDGLAPARQKRRTMSTAGCCLDFKSQPFQHRCEPSVAPSLHRFDTDDESRARGEEMHEPAQRGLDRLDGPKLPLEERKAALAARQPAARGRLDPGVAAAMKLRHDFAASRSGDNDPLRPEGGGKLDHRVDDPLGAKFAGGCSAGLVDA